MTSKDNFEFAHEHRREVAWMSQNTNTLPVHPSILEAIRASADEREFNLYPPKAGIFELSDAIREDLGLDDADMILTNGGIEGEYIATRALLKAGDEALSTDPSFLPIHDQVAMTGARAIEVDIYRKPYVLTPDLALDSITPATKMLLAIDPNNPLGSGYSRSQIKGLADIAQRAALAALQSKKEWLPGIRRICAKNQETIRHTVAKVDGASLPVFPSKANMFVIDLAPTGVKPEVVEERLLFDHLVHTRAGSYLSKKHGGEFLRVTFTVSEADCKRFEETERREDGKPQGPEPQVDLLTRTPAIGRSAALFPLAPTSRPAIRPLLYWERARPVSPKARTSPPLWPSRSLPPFAGAHVSSVAGS